MPILKFFGKYLIYVLHLCNECGIVNITREGINQNIKRKAAETAGRWKL